MVSTLKYWKKKEPHAIIDIITDLFMFINRVNTNEILIKKDLIDGILGLCKNQHPNEILGFLKVQNEIAMEYVLLPGSITNENSGVFTPGRVPSDPAYQGTVHSHPSGIPYPSQADLRSVFRSKRFNFIVGYPYTYNAIRCFDQKGNELSYRIIK